MSKYFFLLFTLTIFCQHISELSAQTFRMTAFDRPERYTLTVDGQQEIRLLIDGFEPGDHFGLQIKSDGKQRQYDFGNLPEGTSRYHGGFIGGTATTSQLDICLESLGEGPGTLQLNLRKNRGFGRLKTASSSFAVENNRDLPFLLNTVFRNESCFELFPDTLITGDQLRSNGSRVMQTGIFTGGSDVFGMESGIILSTGAVTDAAGPNGIVPRGASFLASNMHRDPDATTLLPSTCGLDPESCYNDAAVIEFSFIPTTDTISFNYIFFSEEYCFEIDGSFSDAFAFFLEGPNVQPNGRANIARLPNGEIVTSKNLNHRPGNNPELFRDNSFQSFEPCTGMPNDSLTEQQVAYDGFSVKLEAKAAVTPCERHVLKLIVLDIGGDATLDSGILLEAGSFTAGLIAEPEPSVAGVAGSVSPVEACDTATITFSRLFSTAAELARPLEVNYNLITTGTGLNIADNGTDFVLPPSPFIIPPGALEATLKIPILGDDDPNEGEEAFIIRYDGTCNCDQNRDTFFIQDATDLMLDLSPDQTLCGGQTIDLSAIASGGAAPYTYAWPDGQQTSTISYTATGRDSVILISVVDSCGLTGRDSIQIFSPDVTAQIAGDFSLCNVSEVSVPVSLQGSGGPFTITLEVSTGGTSTTTSYTVSGDTAFTFQEEAVINLLTVANGAGCAGSAAGTATVSTAGVSLSSTVRQPTCDNNDGQINLSVADGNANYTFRWQDDASITSSSRNGLAPGEYVVEITPVDDTDCSQRFPFSLSAPTALSVDSFIFSPPACPGEMLDLAVVVSGGTPPYQYVWPGQTTTDSILSVTTAGGNTIYPVIVTDACGQETSGAQQIFLPVFSASLAGRFSLCDQSSVEVPVTISGPTDSYTLRIEAVGGNDKDTLTVTQGEGSSSLSFANAVTLRLLEVRNGNGCAGEIADTTAIVVDPQLNLAATVTSPRCSGEATGRIELTRPGTVPLLYTWGDGVNTDQRENLLPGDYALTLTDAADPGCSRDTVYTVIRPDPITRVRDSVRNENCQHLAFASVQYTGGRGQLSYRWSNGSNRPELGEVAAGTYTLTVSDENNCTEIQTFMLTDERVAIEALISASATMLSCTQPTIQLSAQQPPVPVIYTWRDTSGQIAGNDRQLTISRGGTFTLNVTDPVSGCSADDTIRIGQSDDLLRIQLPEAYVLNCTVTSVDLTASHPDFTGDVTYEWRQGNTLVGQDATLPDITAAGTFELTATRTDNGCVTIVRTEVSVDRTPPDVTLPATEVFSSCRQPEVSLQVVATGPYRFQWQTNNGNLTGPPNAPVTTADRPGEYRILVIDTLNGCFTERIIRVRENGARLTPDAGRDQTLVCTGNGTALFGSFGENIPGSEGRWLDLNGNEISSSSQALVIAPGAYVFEAIHPQSGCSSFDTVRVIDEAPTEVRFTLQQAPCPEIGGRLFVTGVTGNNGPFTFRSPTGRTEATGEVISGLPAGRNLLIVTDQLGCELRDTFQIFDFGAFTGEARTVDVVLGEEAVLGVTTNRPDGALASWRWENLPDSTACTDCPDPVIRPQESFTALVTVTDSSGCSLTLRQQVFVAEADLVYMPDAFSPGNQDGINDIYTVFGNAEFVREVNSFTVYDRWGNQVFANNNFMVNDPNAGWDGQFRNQVAATGSYVYALTFTLWTGEQRSIRGGITLTR